MVHESLFISSSRTHHYFRNFPFPPLFRRHSRWMDEGINYHSKHYSSRDEKCQKGHTFLLQQMPIRHYWQRLAMSSMSRSLVLVFLSLSAFLCWNACSAFSSTGVAQPPSVTQKLEIQPLGGGPKISLKDYVSKDKTLFIFGTCK